MEMVRRPPYAEGVVWKGLGWSVRDIGGGETNPRYTNLWHTGSLPGTTSLLVRAGNGSSWAVLMNSRPKNWGKFRRTLDKAMWQAFRQVTEWPNHNLFSQIQ